METPLYKEKNWAHYDVSHFPEVKVTLGKKISNDADFQKFLDDWEALYQRDRDFTLHFNTNNVGWVSMKYCFKMRSFIRKQQSIIRNFYWYNNYFLFFFKSRIVSFIFFRFNIVGSTIEIN